MNDDKERITKQKHTLEQQKHKRHGATCRFMKAKDGEAAQAQAQRSESQINEGKTRIRKYKHKQKLYTKGQRSTSTC